MSRRHRLFTLVAGLTALTLALSACGDDQESAAAQAGAGCASMTPAHLLLQTADLDVSYIPYGILAKELGYFAEECVDMTIDVTADATVQSLLNKKTDFGMSAPDVALTAGGDKPLAARMVYNIIPELNIYLAVLPDSPIQSVGDLKGAKIGLSNSSPFYDAFLRESLQPAGLTLDDVQLVTTGYGSTPVNALKSGEVDAVLYWPGMYTAWQNTGLQTRLLAGQDWSHSYDGLGLMARNDTIEQQPELVESVSRAISRSTVYLKKYPESAVKIFWAAYPERAPLPGTDEDDALKKDLAVLQSTLGSMHVAEHPDDYTWGIQTTERWAGQIAYDQRNGIVDKALKLDPADYFTAQFIEAANDFDPAAIKEQS
ncbi:ABC transporter substrate-binding protein [Actinoplanes sp. RD1]|uniref:ABC transporter substrate-binding protein n=1 Tax=Actinoplanes sp. RD1 TaxID=3064538 RepID=UPI002742094B|nr:ABC transporter substrate-binding protein [Actinoplanes sp. RD1]